MIAPEPETKGCQGAGILEATMGMTDGDELAGFEGDAVVYGTKAQIAADVWREGIKMNGIQNGSTTAGQIHDDGPPKPPL